MFATCSNYGRFLVVLSASFGLHGCILDPGTWIMAGIEQASDPVTAQTYTDSMLPYVRSYNCATLASQIDHHVNKKEVDPGQEMLRVGNLNALKQVQAEKSCPVVAKDTSAPAVTPSPGSLLQVPATTAGGNNFGSEVETVSVAMAKALGLNPAKGIMVVSPGKTPTGKDSGLKALDVIVEVAGQSVGNAEELQKVTRNMRPGYKAPVQVWRDRAFKDLSVVITSDASGTQGTTTSAQSIQSSQGWLGAILQNSTPVLASTLSLPAQPGVVITGTPSDGAAAKGGLRVLDVILTADGKAYNSNEELRGYIASKPAGHPLNLEVWRNRSKQDIIVPLAALSPNTKLPEDAAGYCYVLAMPERMAATNNIVWLSHVFPVPDAGSTMLTLRGKDSGESFKKYLQQQGLPIPAELFSGGVCNAGLNVVADSWRAQRQSFDNPVFKASGSEGVVLLWKPW